MSAKKFKSWWVLLWRGIFLIFMAFVIIFKLYSGLDDPEQSLINLSFYFGWMLFMTGIINITGAIYQGGPRDDWNWLLSEGMFDLIVGMIVMIYPFMTGPAVLLIIGIWVMMSSIIQITNALINWKRLKNWWVTVANGILMLGMVYIYLTSDITRSAFLIYVLMGTSLGVLGLINIILSFAIKDMTPRKVRETRAEASDLIGEMKGIPKQKK